MKTIKVTVNKNKFNSFSFVRLEILGSIQTMSFDDYKRLVACVLNPTFTNYMGEEYENDMNYSSMLENFEQKAE